MKIRIRVSAEAQAEDIEEMLANKGLSGKISLARTNGLVGFCENCRATVLTALCPTKCAAAAATKKPSLKIKRGFDIKTGRLSLNEQMYHSILQGRCNAVEVLVLQGASINYSGLLHGNPAWIVAAEHNDIPLAQLLVRLGADVHAANYKGHTALLIASNFGCDGILSLLLAAGANANVFAGYGEARPGTSALYLACQEGHLNCVELLLAAGADCQFRDQDESTPLHVACVKGHEAIVSALLQRSPGLVRDLAGPRGLDMMLRAVSHEREGVVALLLQAGAPADVVDSDSEGEVVCGAKDKDETVSGVINISAQSGQVTKRKPVTVENLMLRHNIVHILSPLFMSAKRGNVSIARRLLDHGAQVDRCVVGGTALEEAVGSGNVALVELFISRGAAVENLKHGMTPLYYSAMKGHAQVCAALLRGGAEVDLEKGNCTTPLIAACQHGRENVVSLLIDAGADVNRVHEAAQGVTPLIGERQRQKNTIGVMTSSSCSPLSISY